ncbi:MAG: hypothetical protein ABEI13_03885, partial [Candidatus Paceibacteria bacterium]
AFLGSLAADKIFNGFILSDILSMYILFYSLIFPGIVILGILDSLKGEFWEKIIMSVATSVVYLLLSYLIINNLGNALGINPIGYWGSVLPLFLCIGILFPIFLDRRDQRFNLRINSSGKSILVALVLIALSIIGSYYVIVYDSAFLLFYGFILFVVIVFNFERFPKKSYPIIILSLTIFLVVQHEFSTFYLQGADEHIEYHYARHVIVNNIWDQSLYSNQNSVLPVVLLLP